MRYLLPLLLTACTVMEPAPEPRCYSVETRAGWDGERWEMDTAWVCEQGRVR